MTKDNNSEVDSDSTDLVKQFLAERNIAVCGASQDRSKYGNQILRALVEAGREPIPINPKGGKIEGLEAYPELAASPKPISALSIVTPPAITENVVQQAIELGIQKIWMQPGAESSRAIELAEQAGLDLLHSGPCILVALRLQN